MISKWKKFLKTLRREEKGITGLETAIILIAFVVVASVFAYTVLSAGIFSSQKGQEAVYAGLNEARSTLELKGSVVGKSSDGTYLTSIVIQVANPLDGEAIDLTAPSDDGDHMAASGSTNVVVASYHSETCEADNLYFTSTQRGWGDNDDLCEAGETFEMEIFLDSASYVENISTYKTFVVEIKPPRGSVLAIERTTPASIDSVMILN